MTVFVISLSAYISPWYPHPARVYIKPRHVEKNLIFCYCPFTRGKAPAKEKRMHLVCLDLEGVLVPEIWIEFSRATGISELTRTTRDEPDYSKLMRFRMDILDRNGLKLPDIQKVIGGMDPLPGALEFLDELRSLTQVVILSDTFSQFAQPLMRKLAWPTLFCNTLEIDTAGRITGFRLRQNDGKRTAVDAFHSMNMKILAAGDSFNDLSMIRAADSGVLFRSPQAIRDANADLPAVEQYADLLSQVKTFLTR